MVNADFNIAVHPGEVLRDILESSEITQTALAQHLRMPQSKISDICRGRRGVSPAMACRLARAFGQSPEFWMNLQTQWDLSRIPRSECSGIRRILPTQHAA